MRFSEQLKKCCELLSFIVSLLFENSFEYFLVPSFDFRQTILKEGNELEVLEPKSLRNAIKKELQTALSRYQ